MDQDPWKWSVADVQQFFREHARRYVIDKPTSLLPDNATFLQTLEDNDVNGISLLTEVDLFVLRDDFAVTKFRARQNVFHCIEELRKKSLTWRARHEPITRDSPVPSFTTPKPDPLPAESYDASASLQNIGENVRHGEISVQDKQGKTRRRLELTSTEPAAAPPTQKRTPTNLSAYLPDHGSEVDELFYGRTAIGREVGDLQPSGEIEVAPSKPDGMDKSFTFYRQPNTIGEVQFVHSRMLYFLNRAEHWTVTRRGQDALAILPYRDGLQQQARSSTVIQVDKQGKCVAIREPAALLESALLETAAGSEELAKNMAPTGEWDFLMAAHPALTDDDGLPLYGESESIDGQSTQKTLDDDDTVSGAVSVESTEDLDQDRAQEIVDECVENFRIQWTETKLPQLEDVRAWSTWKKTKQSRTLRDALIAGAQSRIDHFRNRLKQLVKRILEDKELNEEGIRQTCKVLEVTVQDCEREKWNISVWQRRTEPAHDVQHRKSRAQPSVPTFRADHAVPSFVVHPDDRMSVSPAPANYEELEAIPDDDEERFHTPAISPVQQPEEHDDWNDGDEIALDVSDSLEDSEIQQSGTLESALSEDERPSGDAQPAGQSDLAPASGDAELRDFVNHQTQATDNADSADDELPSPSTFISTQARQKIVKLALSTKRPQQANGPIDLTISSDSPSRSPSPVARKRLRANAQTPKVTDRPLDATSAEVAKWDMTDLGKWDKRTHLLIKMLHSAGEEYRDRLHKALKALGSKESVKQIQDAVRALRDNISKPGDPKLIIPFCARLCVMFTASDTDVLLKPEKAPWSDLLDSTRQIKMFCDLLNSILIKKTSKLFVTPQRPSKNSSQPNTSSAPLEISSSDPESDSSPMKKRRRTVQQSQAAMDTRRDAHARQERYKQRMGESQISDATQLEGMLASNPSSSNIVINAGKEDDEDAIYVHPDIARRMKAHQIEGVRFLWREITNDGEEGAQGCILAHTMGLGKTMQALTLLVALAETSQSNNPRVYNQLPPHMRKKGIRGKRQLRMLVICPPSLLVNWRREIAQWAGTALGTVFVVEPKNKQDQPHQFKLWSRGGGILLIGYQMFRGMVDVKSTDKDGETKEVSAESTEITRILLEDPEIVVSDEVHNLKTQKSATAIATSRIETHSRIGLTGTPMSNNVQEVYALISFVAPGYLGDPAEFNAYYAKPIEEGTYKNSDRYAIRKSIKKLTVLRDEINPKVHRADITVLKGSLKPKTEFVLFVPLMATQLEIYKRFLIALKDGNDVDTTSQVALFAWLAMLTLLTNHPLPFKRKLFAPAPAKKQKSKTPPDSGAATPLQLDTASEEELGALADKAHDQDAYSLGLSEAVVQAVLEGLDDSLDPSRSAKTSILMDIIRYAEECGDKTLVFSTSIATLDYLDDLLSNQDIRFGRIEGRVDISKRTKILEDFHNDEFDVMLISTKAGGVGLNIQGANRVVIFDFSFNPTWEEQAIGRAYRLGQQKQVYVYRFVAGGTFETKIYNKQLFKSSLAQRVVDKKNPRRNAERNASDFFFEPKDIEQHDILKERGKDRHVLDRIIDKYGIVGDDGVVHGVQIRDITTMETLQEEAPDDPLDEEERREVDEEIRLNRTKGRRVGAVGPAVGHLGIPPSTAPASFPPHEMLLTNPAMGPMPAPTQPTGGFRQPTIPAAPSIGGLPLFQQW